MKTTETITTRSGLRLEVEVRLEGDHLEISLQAPASKACVLHWGVRGPAQREWQSPPPSLWPADTKSFDKKAVQTPFARHDEESSVAIQLSPPTSFAFLDFVLFFPDEGRWDNNNGCNYQIALTPAAPPKPTVLEVLRSQAGTEEVAFERVFEVEGQGDLAVVVTKAEGRYRLTMLSNMPGPLVLHWGIARRSPHEWLLPPESVRGPNTVICQQHTAQTPLAPQEPQKFDQDSFILYRISDERVMILFQLVTNALPQLENVLPAVHELQQEGLRRLKGSDGQSAQLFEENCRDLTHLINVSSLDIFKEALEWVENMANLGDSDKVQDFQHVLIQKTLKFANSFLGFIEILKNEFFEAIE